jgi:hypothetical protein
LGPPLIDRFSTYRLTPIDRLKSIDWPQSIGGNR